MATLGVVVAADRDQGTHPTDRQLVAEGAHPAHREPVELGRCRTLDLGGSAGTPQHVHAVAREPGLCGTVAGERRGIHRFVELAERSVDVAGDRVRQPGSAERRCPGTEIVDRRCLCRGCGSLLRGPGGVVEHASQRIDDEQVDVFAARRRVEPERGIEVFVGSGQPGLGARSVTEQPHADRLGDVVACEPGEQSLADAVGVLAVARGQ